MHFSTVTSSAALVAVVVAASNTNPITQIGDGQIQVASALSVAPAYTTDTAAPVYVTEIVTALTTYCPLATQITHGGTTYTVTEVKRPESLCSIL